MKVSQNIGVKAARNELVKLTPTYDLSVGFVGTFRNLAECLYTIPLSGNELGTRFSCGTLSYELDPQLVHNSILCE